MSRRLITTGVVFFFILASVCLSSCACLGDEEDPRIQYQRCTHACQQRQQERQEECLQKCQQRYEEQQREQERERRGRDTSGLFGVEAERGKERERKESQSPYFIHQESLQERVKTSHGRVWVTERFTERSELLKGIENYRVAIMEARPRAFAVPNHWDADALIVVTRGSGVSVLLRKQGKQAINICRGDVFLVPAGTPYYMVNKDREENMQLAVLFIPVNTPGRYRAYFGAGGQNPESFYKSLSREILEAAFNMPWDRLQRLFQQRKEGAIIQASEEQIREIVRRASSSSEEERPWPFASEKRGHDNLFKKRPLYSSEGGQLYEIRPDECEELRELNVGISYANLTSGSMLGPYYNSRATKLALVIQGNGHSEIACPHLSSEQSQQKRGEREGGQGRGEEQEGPETYEGVKSRLSSNTVFVVPAGHPVVTVASGEQNLEVLCFDLNARGNERYPLAGRNAIYKQLEREEAELSFGLPAREIEQILDAQKHEIILPGPEQRREGSMFSILQWM